MIKRRKPKMITDVIRSKPPEVFLAYNWKNVVLAMNNGWNNIQYFLAAIREGRIPPEVLEDLNSPLAEYFFEIKEVYREEGSQLVISLPHSLGGRIVEGIDLESLNKVEDKTYGGYHYFIYERDFSEDSFIELSSASSNSVLQLTKNQFYKVVLVTPLAKSGENEDRVDEDGFVDGGYQYYFRRVLKRQKDLENAEGKPHN